MKGGDAILTSLSLDKFGVGGGSICSKWSTNPKCSSFSSSSAVDEEGNDISLASPFSGHISGAESNKASACSHSMSRSRSKSN